MGLITMNSPSRLLVIGKNGQLAQSLQKLAPLYPQFSFTFADRSELDLSMPASIHTYFALQPMPFDVVINAAAYTAVDKAESEETLADQINHHAVQQLAEIAQANGSYLLHVSTDYVFDGQGYRPYVETDAVAPQNVYGHSKLLGEQAIQASGCRAAIVRTSWVYSEFGHNFVKTMLRLGKERDQLNVIFDQIGSPTYASDLAQVLLQLAQAQSNQANPCELYHYANEGVCSWYDFAQAIFEISGISCQLGAIETKDYPTPAKRPHYSVMNKGKLKQTLGIRIPHWRTSLTHCLTELGS